MAYSPAWVRLSRCSLPGILLTWVQIVCSLITKASAISWLVKPYAIRRTALYAKAAHEQQVQPRQVDNDQQYGVHLDEDEPPFQPGQVSDQAQAGQQYTHQTGQGKGWVDGPQKTALGVESIHQGQCKHVKHVTPEQIAHR